MRDSTKFALQVVAYNGPFCLLLCLGAALSSWPLIILGGVLAGLTAVLVRPR